MTKLKFSLPALLCLLVAAGPGFAQTVSIVSGQGQMTDAFENPHFQPLVVEVLDAAGAPVAGATVEWVVTEGEGTIAALEMAAFQPGTNSMTTITGLDGRASVAFRQFLSGLYYVRYLQSTVIATVGTSSVSFFETTAARQNGLLQVEPMLQQPSTITEEVVGESGQPLAGAVRVDVGVPNVALHVTAYDNDPGTGVACVASPGQPAGVVLSDANGIAVCDLVLSGRGRGNFRIMVGGGFRYWEPFNFDVTPGLPCILRIVSGNNQSGNPGQRLPSPLVAEVTDCGGTRLEGVPVTWSVTQGAGNLTNVRNSSATNGQVSANLTPGPVGGPVRVQVAVDEGTPTANDAPVRVTFTASVNVVISGMDIVSGNNQEAAFNTQFADPLTVQVNSSVGPLSDVIVNFMVLSGAGAVNQTTALTDAQGRASTTVTAGPNAGPLVIVASAGALTAQFNLTVRPPGPSNVTFENGAGFQRNWLSPCGVATIRGSGLAPGIQGMIVPDQFGVRPLPILLAGVSVQFGESYAPIFSVVNMSGQESVSVQVPCELQPGTVPVTIRVGAVATEFSAQIRAIAPGLFEWVEPNSSVRAVILKSNNSIATTANPVVKGEIVRLYATGLGPITPPLATSARPVPEIEHLATEHIIVGLNHGGVQVIKARYVDIGVYEVIFEVPATAPSGNLPLVVAVYQGTDLAFSQPSTIPVL